MCVVLRRGRARGISQGSRRVLHLTGLSQHLKHFQITPFLNPPPTPVRLSLRPQQLNWGPNANWMRASSSSSVQFPNYQLERLPGLMCYLHQIIFKWEKSTVCKWKVEEKKYFHYVTVKSLQACDFTAGGPGLIVLHILTFRPAN